MSKPEIKSEEPTLNPPQSPPRRHQTTPPPKPAKPANAWVLAWIAAVVGLLVYGNSIANQYALDDNVVITDNPHVQKGLAGIPKILTTDSFDTGLNAENTEAAAGGRYRPLSLVSFAVDLAIARTLGFTERKTAAFQHAVNVGLFALSLMLMVFLIRHLFPGSTLIPLGAALLFAVHPVHAEVVANIKSRDEILSLLLLLAALLVSLRLARVRSTLRYGLLAVLVFLALLAKEYSLGAIILIPITTFLVAGWNRGRFSREVVAVGIAIAAYIGLRVAAVGLSGATADDPLNAPFAGVPWLKAFATQCAVLGKSMVYTVFPHPLSSNHGYQVIPFRSFAHPLVWAGALAHVVALAIAFWLTFKRRPLAFAFWFYLLTLFPVSNILVDVGVPFAERFLYHASLGSCILIAWLLARTHIRSGARKLAVGALALVLFAGAARTILRNPQWNTSRSLVLADVESTPRSVFLQYHAGVMHYTADRYDKAIAAFDACTELYPTYGEPYPKRCLAHAKAGNFEAAVADFKIASQILFPEEIASYKTFLKDRIGKATPRTPDEGDLLEKLLRDVDKIE